MTEWTVIGLPEHSRQPLLPAQGTPARHAAADSLRVMGVVLITVAVIVVAVLVNRFVRWQVDRQKVSRFRRNAPWDLTTQDTCVALLLGRIMADGRSGNLAAGTEVVAGVSPSAVSVWDREGRLLGRLPLGRVRGVVLEQQAYGFFVFSGRNYTTGADDYPIR